MFPRAARINASGPTFPRTMTLRHWPAASACSPAGKADC